MKSMEYNRNIWEEKVKQQSPWTVPVTSEDVQQAREGNGTFPSFD
ncbi:hypothetical protein [Paenibacillus lautus]